MPTRTHRPSRFLPPLTAVFLGIFLWVVPASAASFIGAALFPESKAWTDVSGLPKVDSQTLHNLAPELQRLLRSSPMPEWWSDSKDCSATDRIFDPTYQSYAPGYFYRVDADGDGLEDILYTGAYHCSEGDVAILWSSAGKSYELRPGGVQPARALRVGVSPESATEKAEKQTAGKRQVQFLLMDPACCSGELNTYSCTTREDLVPVHMGLSMPTALLETPAPFVFSDVAELRTAPKVDDAYDRNRTARDEIIRVGNILAVTSPYVSTQATCTGKILGRDAGGKWAFVVLDGLCKPVYSYEGADRVGWVRMECLTPITQPKP